MEYKKGIVIMKKREREAVEYKNEFLQKVFSGEKVFMTKNARFFQVPMGDAIFIYGDYASTLYEVKERSELKVVAVFAKGVLYCLNPYMTDIRYGWELENVRNIFEEIKLVNQKVVEEIFPDFYQNLNVEDQKINLDLCEDIARKYLLRMETGDSLYASIVRRFPYGSPYQAIGLQDFVDLLCGVHSLEEIAEQRLDENTDFYEYQKAVYEKTAEMVEKKEVVEDWELELLEALRKAKSLGAKTITVEFLYEMKCVSEKINLEKINTCLISKRDFSEWDFSTEKKGKKVMETLGADYSNRITCEHINSITYRGKVLYLKEKK